MWCSTRLVRVAPQKLILVLFCLAVLSTTNAQTCEKWINNPPECTPVFLKYANFNSTADINVWIPAANVTQEFLAKSASIAIQSFNNPLVDPQCRSIFIEFVCLETFHACYPIPINANLTVILGKLTCRSVCQELNQKCAVLAAQQKKADPTSKFPDCENDVMAITGEKGYPETSSVYPGLPFPIPCTNGDNINVPIVVTENDIDCGDLVFNPNVTPPCSVPCHLPVFSKRDWSIVEKAVLIISFIGFFFTGSLVVLFFCQKSYWRFPKIMHLSITFASTLIYLGILIGFFYDRYQINQGSKETTGCHADGITRKGTTDGICAAQGALVIFGSLAIVFWWFLIDLYLFMIIFMSQIIKLPFGPFLKANLSKISHFIGWGIPAAFTIALLAAKKVGYAGGSPWCFIFNQGEVNHNWEFGAYFIPILVASILGCIMATAVMIRLYYISKSVEGYESGGKRKKKVPKETYRILFFLIILLYLLSFALGYRFDQRTKEEKTTASFEGYYECFFRNQFYPPSGPSECKFENKPNVVLWYFTSIHLAIQGLVLFVFFGMTQKNWVNVKRILRERKLIVSSSVSELRTGKSNRRSMSSAKSASAISGNDTYGDTIRMESITDRSAEKIKGSDGDVIQVEPVVEKMEKEEKDEEETEEDLTDSDSEASIA